MKYRGVTINYTLFILLIEFHHILSQIPTCSPNDLSSLHGFMNSLNSTIPSWDFNATNCCAWRGIDCNNQGRVIGLDLFYMNLKGPISNSLTNLDELKRLNLSLNSFNGIVPKQLFRLHGIELLDLSLNELSGDIPLNLELPAIQIFNISFNRFNSTHPILQGSKKLSSFDISYNSFNGSINTSICNDWDSIKVLRFSGNQFSGKFPIGFGNCTSLTELSVDSNLISGSLPEDLFKLFSLTKLNVQGNDISDSLNTAITNLSNLTHFDISSNRIFGNIPNIFNKLPKLECFSAYSNSLNGPLPSSLSNLSSLKFLSLRNNSLSGTITLDFPALPGLTSLDLGSNLFTGSIPSQLSQCLELKTVNLANNVLTGQIPETFKNLNSLSYLSLSKNNLSNVSSALDILQQCSNLTSLVLTRNFFNEEIPTSSTLKFSNLEVFVIPNCGLLGSVPNWLNDCPKLKVLDLSWNRLQGQIPIWIGKLDHLFYLDLSNNSLSGTVPESLSGMKAMISSDSSSQMISQDFPFFIRRNESGKGLQYKQISSFPPSIILCNNLLTGSIFPGFGNLKKLHVLDLSDNKLSGTIPYELSNMSSLETLNLSHNNLSGPIPVSLTELTFLSSFDVSYNNLQGKVPPGGQFSTFSNSSFDGNPNLCRARCKEDQVGLMTKHRKNKIVIVGMALGIGLGTTLLLAIAYLFVSKTNSRKITSKEEVDSNGPLEPAGSRVVLLFQNPDKQEITFSDIMKATDNFSELNIVGCGGFGLVYKATLPGGKKVAIKRLSGDYGQMEREFHAEVESLSRAQHKNLVLLQGYCKFGNDRLLIYSYMENGSLDYWLHEKLDEGSILDWRTRLKIAQGSVKGLAYLHQSCEPHILHRDIKSSNILLDENFEAHLADFGLARLVLPYDTHVTTDLVGTLGYIPPEYGQSSIATFKGDVYSFGVVLLELLTGKRPVDMSKPKRCRDLISWVLQMKEEKRENEVFDPYIYDKDISGQMSKMLDIACLCLNSSPKLRPLTHQLVTWLDDISSVDVHIVK